MTNRSQEDTGAVLVANCSGFFGDRLTAAREMIDGGPIDFLTGDWLAELTMLILAKLRQRRPTGGFAHTFIRQMEDVMGDCLDRGIRVITNAGGLNPAGCVEALGEVADRLRLSPQIAYVSGDNVLAQWTKLLGDGHVFLNHDTSETLPWSPDEIISANAYFGGWGIVEALNRGANIVITGRVTDATLAAAPAAWFHHWKRHDWDQLAGAIVAGHVIECGCQATGGNYSYFHDVPGIESLGFPIAEIYADGSAIITKHPSHGGTVTVGTVKSQLMYEIGGPTYLNPDASVRLDCVRVEQVGCDRVRLSDARGEPPPSTLKLGVNLSAGFRNTIGFGLTGLDIAAKAEVIKRQLSPALVDIEEVSFAIVGNARENPSRNEEAIATLTMSVRDRDEMKVGRELASHTIELALASVPGFFVTTGAPIAAQQVGVFCASSVPAHAVPQHVTIVGGEVTLVDNTMGVFSYSPVESVVPNLPASPDGPTRSVPLGAVIGARSGDKGGDANLGVFTTSALAFAWLREYLTVERLRSLLPDVEDLPVQRHEFSNLWSLNFVIRGLLGLGVGASLRPDPQAKGLGEYLRSKIVDIPCAVLDGS